MQQKLDATHTSPMLSLFTRRPIQMPNLPSADERPLFYIGVFASIGSLLLLVEILAALLLIVSTRRASKVLFFEALVSVMRATVWWHEAIVPSEHGSPSLFLCTSIYHGKGRILDMFSEGKNRCHRSTSVV